MGVTLISQHQAERESLPPTMSVDYLRKYDQWGIIDPESERPGFGACLWNVEANKTFRRVPKSGATTLVKVLEASKAAYADRPCVGWREVVAMHEVDEGGAKREKIELANEYKWLTYAEYYERVLCLARGLNLSGVKPQSRVVIYAETQRDWMVAAYASFFNNAQVVTIYATLGEEGAIHGINETEATTVFTDARLLKILTKILPKCKSVKTVATMTPCDPVMSDKIKAAGASVYSVDELVTSGKTWQFTPTMPEPSDVAVLMYTSGTTGAPKGVVLSHGNITSMIAAVEHDLDGLITPEDVYLAYLPLAHIMEMATEVSFLALGASMGFGSPHTLTDSGVKLKRPESIGDARCLQPTFMVFAPAVLDKIYQAVQSRRASFSAAKRALFRWGLNSGERHFRRGKIGANRLYNGIVFKKVQQLVGGRVRAIITGSAPLSPEIQTFIQTVLDVPVRQGYGLTETCAGSCVAFWGDNSTGSVGPPTVGACIRLADWPEGNYMNSDKDKPEIGMRRGEILIGGPAVSEGYFLAHRHPNHELKKKNQEDWVEVDGVRFFRTGDIGQIRKDGTVQIIDRKKDLWKGPNGEYVALTKVEAALQLCEYVELSMCYGKTGGGFPVALICPQKRPLVALGQELGAGDDFEALCKDDRVVKAVTEACRAKCKEMKLVDFEIPKKVALIAELWTPENDMLTAAMKLKRPLIAEKHKEEVQAMYA